MSIEIKEYATSGDFDALCEGWRELSARSGSTSVFATWDWQECWWRHYGSGRSLLLLIAASNDRIVGILPLYIESVWLARAIPVRTLRVIGTGGDTSPDYVGPILAPEDEQETARQLAEALASRSHRWDRIELTDLGSGPFGECLVRALGARGLSARLETDKSIQIVRLPASWDEYLGSMPRDRRYRIRRQRRGVADLAAEFDVCREAADIEDAFAHLARLHRARWNSKAPGQGAFRTNRYLAFHGEVVRRCARHSWVRFVRIRVGGQPVAIMYCYWFQREISFFQSGFDPAFGKYSLGNVLMAQAIEYAIKEGATVFDMLQGDHEYKESWSNDRRTTFRLTANNTSLRGHLCSLKERLKEALDRRAGRIARPG